MKFYNNILLKRVFKNLYEKIDLRVITSRKIPRSIIYNNKNLKSQYMLATNPMTQMNLIQFKNL